MMDHLKSLQDVPAATLILMDHEYKFFPHSQDMELKSLHNVPPVRSWDPFPTSNTGQDDVELLQRRIKEDNNPIT
jgi:hypothetical protein